MLRKFILVTSLFMFLAGFSQAQCPSSCSGSNTFLGNSTGAGITTGFSNTFIGNRAGQSNTSAIQNVFLGHFTGANNTTGSNNTFLGSGAGRVNISGASNVFVGSLSGFSNTTGSSNAFLGTSSGRNNEDGVRNTFLGSSAGFDNTQGDNNTFIGYRAGEENTTGSSNTSIGYLAGDNNRTGTSNTYLGARAGQNNQSGSFNVFLGNQAGTSETGSNKLYIDNSSTSAPLIYGDFSTNELSVNGQLGVGIQNPAYPFHVVSNAIVGIQYNGNQSNNAFAGSYMNGARPFYGYKQDGDINAYHYLDADKNFRLWLNNGEKMVIDKDGQLGLGIAQPERPIHLRATNAIFRIDRDRDDPGFAVVRYDQGFQNVWKSFYFYTRGFGPNNGKFIIADWQQNVAGPSTARLVIANNGNVGIGDFLFSNPSQKLTVTGNAQANAFFTSSDKRFKRNIQGIPEALNSLEKMQGVRYEFKQEEFEQQQFSEGPAIGLIAQEVQKVYPELVAEDEEGYLSVNYDGLIPVLMEALKEEKQARQQEAKNLKAALQALKERLDQLNVQLEGEPEAQLFQNRPNPFTQSTDIPYYLPENQENALIIISDLQGKEIRREANLVSGKGTVSLEAGSLTKGIYLYTLVLDGKVMASKRMLIE